MLADSASFLVSAFLVAPIAHWAAAGGADLSGTPGASEGGAWTRAWGECREGVHAIREERPLGALFALIGDAVGAVPLFGITAVVWLAASFVASLTLDGSPESGTAAAPPRPGRAPTQPWDWGRIRILRPRPQFAASPV